ncbi:MAG: hypothetical protein ACRDRL_08650, partial [Sciscionella sp.]
MAWTEKRASGRYAGLYRDRDGKRRSVGTWSSKRRAESEAWKAEDLTRGRADHDPTSGLILWRDWAELWFPTRKV